MRFASITITPNEAYDKYRFLLEKSVTIFGQSGNLTEENIKQMLPAVSNVVTYSRESKRKKPYKDIDGIQEAPQKLKSQVKEIYRLALIHLKKISRTTKLHYYVSS